MATIRRHVHFYSEQTFHSKKAYTTMGTKHIITALGSMAVLLSATSCNDWLTEESPGSTSLDDFFTSGATAIQTINACYTPLAWEYNSTYFSEWFIGDVC